MALRYAGIEVEHREIALRDKPKSMLQVSPKGTVPVLCLNDQVIDQSVDIMHWALDQSDPDGWRDVDQQIADDWIKKNDGPFKKLLDQYKYPNRNPELNPEEVLNAAVKLMLDPMESTLRSAPFLLGSALSWVDVAIFPFIRQFSMVNPQQFCGLPIPHTQDWLRRSIQSDLFESVMDKYPTWTE